ncbi:hypothetical protein BJY52DRAFT_149966 [Lactarius psammicola]|nr:hypothetical protein BJY52DRAFT_149966 [Lactarius psammicola]
MTSNRVMQFSKKATRSRTWSVERLLEESEGIPRGVDNMLTNSLSLNEEDAVQAELKELQQGAVGSLPHRRTARIAHHNIGISYMLRATKKHCSRSQSSHHRTRITRTGYFTSHLATSIVLNYTKKSDTPKKRHDRASCDPCSIANE